MYKKRIQKILVKIKFRRLKLGYTQSFMADKLNIGQNTYSKLEQNKITLTACRFAHICDILEVNPDEILNPK